MNHELKEMMLERAKRMKIKERSITETELQLNEQSENIQKAGLSIISSCNQSIMRRTSDNSTNYGGHEIISLVESDDNDDEPDHMNKKQKTSNSNSNSSSGNKVFGEVDLTSSATYLTNNMKNKCNSVKPIFNFGCIMNNDWTQVFGDLQGIQKAILFNYQIEFDVLLTHLPGLFALLTNKTLTIVGHRGIGFESNAAIDNYYKEHQILRQLISNAFCFKFNPPEMYATHHAKLFLLEFKDFVRIGIMSANYGSDLHEMQQGFFVRDLPFLPANGRVLPQGHDIFENTTSLENYFNQLSSNEQHFGTDLIDYISQYTLINCADRVKKANGNEKNAEFRNRRIEWLRLLNRVDYGRIGRNTRLVGSVPGRHKHERFGHWKVRRILRELYTPCTCCGNVKFRNSASSASSSSGGNSSSSSSGSGSSIGDKYIVAQNSSISSAARSGILPAIERSFTACKSPSWSCSSSSSFDGSDLVSTDKTNNVNARLLALWPSKADAERSGGSICLDVEKLLDPQVYSPTKCHPKHPYDLQCTKHWKLHPQFQRYMFKLQECGHGGNGAGGGHGLPKNIGCSHRKTYNSSQRLMGEPAHLKSYAMVCHPKDHHPPSNPYLGWMMVGSHNLSDYAWGQEMKVKKDETPCLKGKSFELSVLSIASGSDGGSDSGEGSHGHLPSCNSLPYNVRREIQEQFTKVGDDNVTSDDVPWTWSWLKG